MYSDFDKSECFSEIVGGKGHEINAGNNVLVSDIHFYHILSGTGGFFSCPVEPDCLPCDIEQSKCHICSLGYGI